MSLLSAATVGLLFIVVAMAVAMARFAVALRSRVPGKAPVAINIDGLRKLVQAAVSGNKDALFLAAQESLDIWVRDGSFEEKVLELAFDDIERQLRSPDGKAPIIKLVAHFTGKSEQEVFEAFKAEFLRKNPVPPPVPAPVVPAVIALTLLLFCGTAMGASPMSPPDAFYKDSPKIVLDPIVYSPASPVALYSNAIEHSSCKCQGQCNCNPCNCEADTIHPSNHRPVVVAGPSRQVFFVSQGPVRRGVARAGGFVFRAATFPFRIFRRRGC